MADTSNITNALRSLGAFGNGIIPHRIAGSEPDMQDAIEFQKELLMLAARVDRVIEAYGEYLNSNGVLSADDVKDCFRNVLHDALDGNALFCIQSGVEDRLQAIEDEAADHERDRRRDDAMMGV